MSSPTWKEHFKTQIAGIEGQYSPDPQNPSLLGYAIQENALSSDEYLQWAIENEELPVLQSNFFSEQKPNQQLFDMYKDQYTWSKTCLPVSEWDGSLLVACLEKPENYNSSTPTIFLLAAYEDLQTWWQAYQPEVAKPVLKPSVAQPATVATTNPFDLVKNAVTKDPKKAKGMDTDMPAGLKMEPDVTEEQPAMIINPNDDGGFTRLNMVPESSQVQDLSAVTAITGLTKTASSFSKTKTGTHTSDLASKYIIDMIRDTDPTFIPYMNGCFDKMKIHFKNCYLLAVDNTEINARTVMWDDAVNPPDETSVLRLTNPSIFGLVSYTLKPYHGYISPSENNEKFFEEWNSGHTPDHATVVPIMFMGRLVGLLVGIGEKSAYTKAVLKYMRKLGKDVSAKVSGQDSSDAKAA